ASAKQRAGRAGREAPGKVFRLYSEKVFNERLPKEQESEIMRNDIVLPVLTLKKIGVDDLLNWPWLEHPGEEAILSALSNLYSLGALDGNGKITTLGYKMAILPLPPQLSAVLITAIDNGVVKDVVDIVACLSVDNLILNVTGGDGEQRHEVNVRRRTYCPLGCQYGDLIAFKEYFSHFEELLNAGNVAEAKDWCHDLHFSYKGFRNVLRVRQQLKEYMLTTIKQDDRLTGGQKEKALLNLRSQLSLDMELQQELVRQPLNIPEILKCFVRGYITNTAIGMPDRSYRTCNNGSLISIHPSSNLFGKANLDSIMYVEYVFTSKGYARNCSAIELSWLQEIAPHVLGGTKVSINE
ncbi:HA2-domain-containing protein, partial [Yamadazyma tenuis ATCC 10573]